jgi:hypothetical protein
MIVARYLRQRMAVVFDTHKQHKSLVEAGLSEPQAEAITGMAAAVLSVVATKADLESFATKADLKLVEAKFETKFDAIDKRFEDFNKSLNRMNAVMIGQLTATIGVIGAMFAIVAPHVR